MIRSAVLNTVRVGLICKIAETYITANKYIDKAQKSTIEILRVFQQIRNPVFVLNSQSFKPELMNESATQFIDSMEPALEMSRLNDSKSTRGDKRDQSITKTFRSSYFNVARSFSMAKSLNLEFKDMFQPISW